LENYIVTDDWQCRYIRYISYYVCHTKQGDNQMTCGQLIATTKCITL